jgi:hypothetical protein
MYLVLRSNYIERARDRGSVMSGITDETGQCKITIRTILPVGIVGPELIFANRLSEANPVPPPRPVRVHRAVRRGQPHPAETCQSG